MVSKESNCSPRLSDKPRLTVSKPEIGFGSDAVAEQLSRLDLDYIALVPGSSYRGLHDSIVNYNGNVKPEMLICRKTNSFHMLHPSKLTSSSPRGTLRSNCSWLCQSCWEADGGRTARERWSHACHDGDI
jgi:hypothetical protein